MQTYCESVIINNLVACCLFLVYSFCSYAFILERYFIMRSLIRFWQQAFNFKQKISWRQALSRVLTNLIFIIILYVIALIAPPSWEEPIAYFVQVYTIISIIPIITTIISALKQSSTLT